MAQKRIKDSKLDDKGKVQWQGFCQVYLTPQDKAAVKQGLLDDQHAFTFLQDMAERGYKVSLTWSDKGSFWSVTLYGSQPDNPNAGWAMTLRHSDLLTAVTALEFKVDQYGRGEAWEGKLEVDSNLTW